MRCESERSADQQPKPHLARTALERRGMTAGLLGHIGDGDYHVVLVVDPDDPDELAQAKAVDDDQLRNALELGGTCAAEHGIGLGKIPHLELE